MDQIAAIKQERSSWNNDSSDAFTESINGDISIKEDYDSFYRETDKSKFYAQEDLDEGHVKKYVCKICGGNLNLDSRVYDTKSKNLTRICTLCAHKNRKISASRNKTKERLFTCSLCPAAFSRKTTLKKHEIIHTGVKPFQCKYCDKACFQKVNLDTHIKSMHFQEKPFSCDFCTLTFKLKGTLNQHLIKHTGEKPYKCKICSKMFPYTSSLTTHMKSVHATEKPFSCDICNATFPVKQSLRQHKRSHEEKHFKCKTCDSIFSRNSHLRSHISSVHLKEKPFVCKVCNGTYAHRSTLKGHLITHSGVNPYKCDFCEKRI